ncbi:hypothetical protein B5807_07335 [Epicoccum nigrum]|uniref:Uncharacterized protein n=1 Tax=Epicoccum nigrum TaxID=105696 RepID=A0A1Y2LU62_EPING|nr:hypothetical protein B5807_07335 [Epicoccum nigrum]
MPEIPEPNSRHVESDDRRPEVKKMLEGDAIHSANRGVTAHTTAWLSATYLLDHVELLCMSDGPKQDKYPNPIPESCTKACTKASQEGEILGHYCGVAHNVPAPVVPALRSLVSRPLLWEMTRSTPATQSSSASA